MMIGSSESYPPRSNKRQCCEKTVKGDVLSIFTHIHNVKYQKFVYEVLYKLPDDETTYRIFIKCISKHKDGRYNWNSVDEDPFEDEKQIYALIHERKKTILIPKLFQGGTICQTSETTLHCTLSHSTLMKVTLTLKVKALESYYTYSKPIPHQHSMWCIITESMSNYYVPLQLWLRLHDVEPQMQERGIQHVFSAIDCFVKETYIMHNDLHSLNILVKPETFALTNIFNIEDICFLDFDISDDLTKMTFKNHINTYLKDDNDDNDDTDNNDNNDIRIAKQSISHAIEYAIAWDQLKLLNDFVLSCEYLTKYSILPSIPTFLDEIKNGKSLLKCCLKIKNENDDFNYVFKQNKIMENWYTRFM